MKKDNTIDYEKIRDIIKEENDRQIKLIEARFVTKETFNKLQIATIVGFITIIGGVGTQEVIKILSGVLK